MQFTFYYLHWLKGAPLFKGTQYYNDKYDRLTFWEQLDAGQQFTLNKKFLTIVPIVLCATRPARVLLELCLSCA